MTYKQKLNNISAGFKTPILLFFTPSMEGTGYWSWKKKKPTENVFRAAQVSHNYSESLDIFQTK